MKTKYKYIHFEETPFNRAFKEKSWCVRNNKTDGELGIVSYYSGWRQFVFSPAHRTIYSQDCLADIIDFIGQLEKK